MNVTQISIGRFHHFHLARQMEHHDLLNAIWTGYPMIKLRDEQGIPQQKIHTFPWLHTPYMLRWRLGLADWQWLNNAWAWWAHETLDRHVASVINQPTVLIALSSSGLYAGKVAQRVGGKYICDRGSAHIRYQDNILRDEYERWGLKFPGVDTRVIAKEELEYEQANYITVPSEFVKQSFLDMGVPEHKLIKVVYGARLDRFRKVKDLPKNCFRVLWVGQVSLRKGFLDMLEAFNNLKHPKKELIVVGAVTKEVKFLLAKRHIEDVRFLSVINNSFLPEIYSESHVLVLPSIEEGLAMVLGEALACGCPVIATNHTGADDLFSDGVEGFIVPIRSPSLITKHLQQLADDNALQSKMSEAAILRVKSLGGWNNYGNTLATLIKSL